MGKSIQIVNYSGTFESEIFKINKLSAPESFDDYEINIIDLSNEQIWRNNGSQYNSINSIADIKNIATMLTMSKNKVLIVLPQNISMKYYWAYNTNSRSTSYAYSIELKNNIQLINYIIEILIGKIYNNSWIMYNKTTSIINDINSKSDFVFHNIKDTQKITYNSNKTLVTTMMYISKYFTTLNLSSEYEYLNYFKNLGWITEQDQIPDWLLKENFFDDIELNNNKNNLLNQMENIKKRIEIIDEKLNKNMFYKSGLFKSGDELVEIVNEILRQMVDYEPEKFKDLKEEDFLFENNGHFFIGEIKGINSNINRSNVTQTATHKNLYMEIEGNENKQVFAIAIINRQRTKPLKERDEVSKDVIELAKINKVLLIKMETLLQLFDRFKQNKISKDDILNLFMTETGLLELKNED